LPANAQIYSVNAVGYVDIGLSAGSNYIANPLASRNHAVSNLLPTLPVGAYIKTWSAAAQNFESTNYFTASGWSDPAARLVLPDGVVLWTPAAAQVSFTGEMFQGSVNGRMMLAGLHILGVMPRKNFFVCGNFSECLDASNPPDNTVYYQWIPAQQRFTAYYYIPDLGWVDEFGNTVTPSIPPGQSGLFYVPSTFYILNVPPPGEPQPLPSFSLIISDPRRTTTNVSFRLTATNETEYGIWRSTNLSQLAWQHLVGGTASVGTATITISDVTNATAFYKAGPLWKAALPLLYGESRTNGQFRFSFCAETNITYAVERTTVVGPTSWNPIGSITAGEKSCVTFVDTNATAARAFYRLRQ
jgi:hypothetical protein